MIQRDTFEGSRAATGGGASLAGIASVIGKAYRMQPPKMPSRAKRKILWRVRRTPFRQISSWRANAFGAVVVLKRALPPKAEGCKRRHLRALPQSVGFQALAYGRKRCGEKRAAFAQRDASALCYL